MQNSDSDISKSGIKLLITKATNISVSSANEMYNNSEIIFKYV